MEISRGGWKGVKVVGVEWYVSLFLFLHAMLCYEKKADFDIRALESIKAGKRLAESNFSVLNIAPKGQRSVAGFFGGA